jgi:hypothetical protein
MKKFVYLVVAIILIIGLIGCAQTATKQSEPATAAAAPKVMATPMVAMTKDAKVAIKGTGFKPGEEIQVLFTDKNGVIANVLYALDPKPVAKDTGQWETTWNAGGYISKNLIKEGVTAIEVTDADFNLITHAAIAFCSPDAAIPTQIPLVEATPMVTMTKDAVVTIKGKGFKPGEEIQILFTDKNGVTANVLYALEPKPVASNTGDWETTWKAGGYISKNLIKEGINVIEVTDSDFNLLSHASMAFYPE